MRMTQRLSFLSLLAITALSLSPLSLSAGGDDTPVKKKKKPKAPKSEAPVCGPSNRPHPNPLKEELHPSINRNGFHDSFNYEFHAWQELNEDCRYPVYRWFQESSTAVVHNHTILQPQHIYDAWGCYRGTYCVPVLVQSFSPQINLTLRIVRMDSIEAVFETIKDDNLFNNILDQLDVENVFGGLVDLRHNNPQNFLDKFLLYSHRDLPNERWMSTYDARGNAVDGEERPQPNRPKKKQSRYTPPQMEESAKGGIPFEERPTPSKSKQRTQLQSPPVQNEPEVKKGEEPFGISVKGKPGIIYSPYSGPDNLIDASGLARGTRITDDYSGKIIRVP
jgi:hypothetical protein